MKPQSVTWQPLHRAPGQPIGIALHRPFALACMKISLTEELQERMVNWIWGRVKPADWNRLYIPSDILQFNWDTLLVTTVQRYSDHGEWLNCDSKLLAGSTDTHPLIYNYHHASDQLDTNANVWLEYTFSYWVRFAHIILQEQGGEYLEIL